LKARVDVHKTVHGWEVFRWQVGSRPWQEGNPTDAFISEATRPGFKLFSRATRLIPVDKPGYWNADDGPDLSEALRARVELTYPLPLRGAEQRCQAKWNDRTNTLTGCERPAVGRFVVKDSSLRRRRIRLCVQCGGKA